MADTDIPKKRFTAKEIFNMIAVDYNDDGEPDAIAVCNPDGSDLLSS